MNDWEKYFYDEKIYSRLYAYAMQSLKKNQDVLKRMQEDGKNITLLEIDIEAAEYALGMRDDKPKLHRFVEKHRAEKLRRNSP
ncbi:MAG: hypothetical protein II304_07390 [Bacteroidales bacterium]|nr:hypothetical protein [Bacteroidales bacterium]